MAGLNLSRISLRYFERAGQPSEPQAIRQPCRQIDPGLRGMSARLRVESQGDTRSAAIVHVYGGSGAPCWEWESRDPKYLNSLIKTLRTLPLRETSQQALHDKV